MSTWKAKIFQSIKKVMDLSLFFYSYLSVSAYLESFKRFSMAIQAQRKLRMVRISSRKPGDKVSMLPPLFLLRADLSSIGLYAPHSVSLTFSGKHDNSVLRLMGDPWKLC